VTTSPAARDDPSARYAEYLARFAREVGQVKVDGFAKFAGRLIKKLSFEEFTPLYVEFTELHARYQDSVDRGDTINDLVLKLLRDQAASLVLPAPSL